MSKSKSPRNLQVNIPFNSEVPKEAKAAKDYISTRTLLNDGKSAKDPSQNMEQLLTTNTPNGGPTVSKGSTLANVANENSNEESL